MSAWIYTYTTMVLIVVDWLMGISLAVSNTFNSTKLCVSFFKLKIIEWNLNTQQKVLFP